MGTLGLETDVKEIPTSQLYEHLDNMGAEMDAAYEEGEHGRVYYEGTAQDQALVGSELESRGM